MAAHTGRCLNRVPSMGLLERSLGAVMTRKTEKLWRLYQKILLVGGMSEMAGAASLLS